MTTSRLLLALVTASAIVSVAALTIPNIGSAASSTDERSGPGGLSDEPATIAVEVPLGTDRRDVPRPTWVARQVTIGTREDVRREGALILHKVLQMRSLERPPKVLQANTTLIYAETEELLDRVEAALDGRVEVKPGIDALFALGRLAPVRIVRLGADGRVRSVEDARVSFVGFSFEDRGGR